jgi:hypothetical protein
MKQWSLRSRLKKVLVPVGLVGVTLGAIAPLGSMPPGVAATSPQETTLALCETPNYTVRLYQLAGDDSLAGETLMRAYNRQYDRVWLSRTPVSRTTTPAGTAYTNLFGEQTVTMVVNSDGTDCTIQVGDNAPQAGKLLSTRPGNDESLLSQVAELYPEIVAELEAACESPAHLSVESFQNAGQPPRARFTCWSAPDPEGERTGQWLGNLPLTADDPTFITPFTCSAGDPACETQLAILQAQHPDVLATAELACSVKNGSLFFATLEDTLDLRCGYFATTLWDTNGDGIPEYEDPISVDVSVGQVPL